MISLFWRTFLCLVFLLPQLFVIFTFWFCQHFTHCKLSSFSWEFVSSCQFGSSELSSSLILLLLTCLVNKEKKSMDKRRRRRIKADVEREMAGRKNWKLKIRKVQAKERLQSYPNQLRPNFRPKCKKHIQMWQVLKTFFSLQWTGFRPENWTFKESNYIITCTAQARIAIKAYQKPWNKWISSFTWLSFA